MDLSFSEQMLLLGLGMLELQLDFTTWLCIKQIFSRAKNLWMQLVSKKLKEDEHSSLALKTERRYSACKMLWSCSFQSVA